jgi:hypothetical protein
MAITFRRVICIIHQTHAPLFPRCLSETLRGHCDSYQAVGGFLCDTLNKVVIRKYFSKFRQHFSDATVLRSGTVYKRAEGFEKLMEKLGEVCARMEKSPRQYLAWLVQQTVVLTFILLMWTIGRAPNSIPVYSYIQQDATLHSLFISENCSTCFGWYFHPSSGTHTTVSTASCICHTVTAICRYRGRVRTGLSVLWVA